MVYQTRNYKPRYYEHHTETHLRSYGHLDSHKHFLVGGSFSSAIRGFWDRTKNFFSGFARKAGKKAMEMAKEHGKELLKTAVTELGKSVGAPIASAIVDKIKGVDAGKFAEKLVTNPKEAFKDLKEGAKELAKSSVEHVKKGGRKTLDTLIEEGKKRGKSSVKEMAGEVGTLAKDLVNNGSQLVTDLKDELDPELKDTIDSLIAGETSTKTSGKGYKKTKGKGKGKAKKKTTKRTRKGSGMRPI